jgi:hypothetical protein
MINQQANRPSPHFNVRKAISFAKRVTVNATKCAAALTSVATIGKKINEKNFESDTSMADVAVGAACLGMISGGSIGAGFSYIHDIKIDPSNTAEKILLPLITGGIVGGVVQASSNEPVLSFVAGLWSSCSILFGIISANAVLRDEGVEASRIRHEANGAIAPIPIQAQQGQANNPQQIEPQQGQANNPQQIEPQQGQANNPQQAGLQEIELVPIAPRQEQV